MTARMESPIQMLRFEFTPASRKGSRLETCAQVSSGDLIEARVGTTVHVRGQVLDIQPAMELFWVASHGGTRRIVELSEYDVYFAA